jgi:hypothetical protein
VYLLLPGPEAKEPERSRIGGRILAEWIKHQGPTQLNAAVGGAETELGAAHRNRARSRVRLRALLVVNNDRVRLQALLVVNNDRVVVSVSLI